MSFEDYRQQLDATPFAVLATHGPDDRLDLVPCCFAIDDGLDGPELVTAVDHKPKRHRRLARLANVERNQAVSLLVDHRDDDWSKLWWLRAHGLGRVVDSGEEHRSAVDALVGKYQQYRAHRPEGPAIRIAVVRWATWKG